MKFNYNRLKAERVAKGYTVEDMGRFIGVTKGSYSKKENGKAVLTVEEFSTIIKELKFPKDDIGIFFTSDVANSETKTTA